MWIDRFGIDGFRVMCCVHALSGLRTQRWRMDSHSYGGNYNSTAIDFEAFNQAIHEEYPNVISIEESTAFPMVTQPPVPVDWV